MSETEERLRQERAARAERARQMMERTRSLDERLRDQPAPPKKASSRVLSRICNASVSNRRSRYMSKLVAVYAGPTFRLF